MNRIRKSALALFSILIISFAAGCISSDDASDDAIDPEYAYLDIEQIENDLDIISLSELSADEIAGILYMREEEKLARDVYLTFYELWEMPIFANIASSEETHTGAVETLISRYGLEDPFIDEQGVFENDVLQSLYTDLVASGSDSLVNALLVGAHIEELDMIDIASYIATADNQDIILVYESLMMGSRNHLRSYVSTLQKEGVIYEPIYLSDTEFNAIIDSEMESNQHMRK